MGISWDEDSASLERPLFLGLSCMGVGKDAKPSEVEAVENLSFTVNIDAHAN